MRGFKKRSFELLELGIRCLFILLFVYAAVSKLVDYETFENQLGQSPLLSAFASWVAPGVIIIELIIAILLVFDRTRLFALFGFYTMMVLFTTYIIIILNFTDFIPCSCGGVLEQLGWTEHLIFNIGFMLLAVAAIFLVNERLLRFARNDGGFASLRSQ